MCGGEEQDSTSGHVGKHPGNSVNHTMEAKQERSTSPCGKMDMKKKRNGTPDSVLESTKKTRTTGEKMDGLYQRIHQKAKKTQQTESNESEKWLEAEKDTSNWNNVEDVYGMRRDRTLRDFNSINTATTSTSTATSTITSRLTTVALLRRRTTLKFHNTFMTWSPTRARRVLQPVGSGAKRKKKNQTD